MTGVQIFPFYSTFYCLSSVHSHPFEGSDPRRLGLDGGAFSFDRLVRKLVIPQFYMMATAISANQTVKERMKAIHVESEDSL